MSTSNAAVQRGELPFRDSNQPRSALVIDTIHHRGETIRLVNEGLSDPIKASSDELIAAVSTLLTIEVSWKLAQMDMNLTTHCRSLQAIPII